MPLNPYAERECYLDPGFGFVAVLNTVSNTVGEAERNAAQKEISLVQTGKQPWGVNYVLSGKVLRLRFWHRLTLVPCHALSL